MYLSTFSKSNAWDFRLINTGISENVPVPSEDFRRFSEHFRTFPKMSEDVETTFEHFRSYLEDENFRLFWFRWDAKSSFDAFLEHFLGNWIEFSLSHVLKKRFVRICESGVRNCPWCVRSMSLFGSREIHASWVKVGRYINYISSFVFDLLSLQCSWFDSGISIACDSGIKG